MKSVFTAIAILFLVCGMTGCDKAAATSNDWERARDCAAAADRFIEREYHNPRTFDMHYSPKYERCFVEVAEGPTSSRLWDVFENQPLAFTSSFAGCGLINTDVHADCATVKRYWDDRMERDSVLSMGRDR